MADSVGQNDEVLRRVEQLSGPKKDVAKNGSKKLRSGAARAMSNQHGVLRCTRTVSFQRANRAVVHFQFRQSLAAAKVKILNDVITFDGRRVVSGRRGLV